MGRANVTQGKIQNAIAKGYKTSEQISEISGIRSDELKWTLNAMEKAGIVDRHEDGSYSFSDRVFGVDEVKKPLPKLSRRAIKITLSLLAGVSMIIAVWGFNTSLPVFLFSGTAFVLLMGLRELIP